MVTLSAKGGALTLLNLPLDPPLHKPPSFHGSLPPARRRQMRAEVDHMPGESKLVDPTFLLTFLLIQLRAAGLE